jgi:hypothetical protein
MYQYQYLVTHNEEEYIVSIYDKYGRKHFTTFLSQEDFELYESDKKAFVEWLEETFDDVLANVSK